MKTEVHPVRAILAVGAVGITAFMMITGIAVPDAWWVIVTGLALWYVGAEVK